LKKTSLLSKLFIVLGGFMVYLGTSSYSSGITGSTSGCSCHNSNSSATALSITGIPTGGWVPGTAYALTATVTNTTKTGAGFDLSVNVGTLSGAPSGAALSGSKEIYHTSTKTMTSGVASWAFTWTAPTSSATALTINFAGNAVNKNNSSSGDIPNAFTQTYPAATTPAPTATVAAASSITATAGKLNGSVNANGQSTTVTFEYGTTVSYGSSVAATPGTVTGSTATSVSANISSLTANTLYHYRVKAVSSGGTTYSSDGTFTTAKLAVAGFAEAGFKLYPNPCQNQLVFDAGSKNVSASDLQVMDFSGRILALPIAHNGFHYTIDVSSLATGNYCLMIRNQSGNYAAVFQKI